MSGHPRLPYVVNSVKALFINGNDIRALNDVRSKSAVSEVFSLPPRLRISNRWADLIAGVPEKSRKRIILEMRHLGQPNGRHHKVSIICVDHDLCPAMYMYMYETLTRTDIKVVCTECAGYESQG